MGIMAANSEYVIAANALVTPARMMEMRIAEPAPRWPASPLMAVPIAAKIPAPMMAPMPSAVSCRGPRERRSPPPISLSATHWSTVFRAKSWDMSLRLFDCRLARDLDRVDAGDRLAVPGASGREPVRLHAPHEVPPTGGILGQRIDLHVGHPAVRRDPEPQLVAAPRRAVGRDNQAFQIGAENVTPFSTRTRAHLAARPGARALPAAGPGPLTAAREQGRAAPEQPHDEHAVRQARAHRGGSVPPALSRQA